MRRRDFIKVVSAGILAWPRAARGQQSGKTWRVGFIAHRYESFYDGLFDGLRELGYVEGQNIIVERRYAEGHAERFQEFAADIFSYFVPFPDLNCFVQRRVSEDLKKGSKGCDT